MILQAARVIVIDDDEQHLAALSRAIGKLGSACLSFHYQDEHPTNHQLAGVRLIFCDLHLGGDTLTSDKTIFYANIASMLAEGISINHGPYLLIVWSQYGEELDKLNEYMSELEQGQRPFAIVPLDKTTFIDAATGQVREDENLVAAVEEAIESQPALAAMLHWEELVARAASRTTSGLWELCLELEENDPDAALRNTLGRLAKGAGGSNASDHPGHSVREALTPLLDDQIATAQMDEDRWSAAVRFGGGAAAPSSRLYTALHLEIPSAVPASARGVASSLPLAWSSMCEFEKRFGSSPSDVLRMCGYAGESLDCAVAAASWYLVQINAACDDGSRDPGYLPYCLAATVPTKRTKDGESVRLKANQSRKNSVEKTREVELQEGKNEWLFLFGSFVMGLRESETEDFAPVFRIRPSLLDKLILGIRVNSARLGVVEP